jgi:hypothetical protein
MKTIKMLSTNHYIDSTITIRENTLVYVDYDLIDKDGNVSVSVVDSRSFIFGKQFVVPTGFLTAPYGSEKLKENEFRLKEETTINDIVFSKGRIFSLYKQKDDIFTLQLLTNDGWATVCHIDLTMSEIENLFVF